ncbi:MAG: S1C family serine protease, partial [Candidatus Izemoplasmatales bacterium]
MKKIMIFLGMVIFTLALVGCANLFPTVENTTRTFLTRSQAPTTASQTINEDVVISELYKKIYESLYDEVKEDVINDIAEERFEQIYNTVILALLNEIELGNIDVTAESIVDKILTLEANQANAVIGVSNLDASNEVQAVGSGVIYKKDGNRYYVLTNQHVVEDGTSFKVVFSDETEINATLRGVDNLVDIAVLYFESSQDLPIVSFGDSDALNKGQLIIAVGNPSGYTYYGSMTLGIISGLQRYFDIDNDGVNDMFVGYIQHDAAINSGNSGGALFNLDGELIGVNVIKLTSVEIEGMGFAIPSNLVKDITSDIEEFGYSLQKPVLGIRFID